MASSLPNQNINNYYLQVQALTPVSTNQTVTPDLNPPILNWQVIYLPIFLFLAVIISGFLLSFRSKIHNYHYVKNSFKLALIVAATPVIISFLHTKMLLTSKASPEYIPRNIEINAISTNQLNISWQTSVSTLGAISLTPIDKPSSISTYVSNQNIRGSNHSLVISDLKPGKTYQVYIFSEGSWYANNNQPLIITLPSN